MGWFVDDAIGVCNDLLFSSPSGDGLVQEHGTSYSYGEYFRPRVGMGWFKNTEHHTVTANIFVPAWGWVGSLGVGIHPRLLSFSSPSGDGLVLNFGETIEEIFVFSSPLGDGLVQSLLYHPKACFSFSSPSGDGLVHNQ